MSKPAFQRGSVSRSRSDAFVLTLAMICAAITPMLVCAQDEAPADSTPPGASYTLETTSGYFNTDRAYFAPGAAHWGEGFSRARLQYLFPSGVQFTAGGVLTTTVRKDYYGVADRNDGLLDQLSVSASDLGGSGLGITLGRQSIQFGDGFLIGDGYLDHRAALWSIPLSFYDGAKLDWARGTAHVTAFAADYSPSFEGALGARPDGYLFGAEAGWTCSKGNEIALAYLRRHETSLIEDRAQAISLRGGWLRGSFSVAGEAVLESGTRTGTVLAGRGGHIAATWTSQARWQPTLKAAYFLFSGDDQATSEDESYDPWQFVWGDWSAYYVGDLLGSTVGTSSNMRIALVQLGVTPHKGTGVRLLAHRMDRDLADTRPFAYEIDAVVDQSIGEHWTAWIMGGLVTPLSAAELEFGSSERSTQLFASLTYKFGGRLGH